MVGGTGLGGRYLVSSLMSCVIVVKWEIACGFQFAWWALWGMK